jgi:hypothetical protein
MNLPRISQYAGGWEFRLGNRCWIPAAGCEAVRNRPHQPGGLWMKGNFEWQQK